MHHMMKPSYVFSNATFNNSITINHYIINLTARKTLVCDKCFFHSLPPSLSLSLILFSSFHPFLFAIILVSFCRRCCCCCSSLFICLSFSIQNCCNAKTKQKLKNVLSIKLFCCHASFELSFESITHTLATIYAYI